MSSTPPDIGEPTREARTGREDRGQRGNKWWTLVAVCLGTFMLLLDITIVNVALPDIQRALHSSFADLQWIVDAYALTLASFLLTAGSLADMYGRRVLYLIGLVVFTGASALCGFATSTLMLQLSRGLQGVGGAIMFAVSLALLANAFRGKDRGVAFGVWGAVTGLAVAIGPLIGGVLTSGLSWRWIFFVNVPIGIAAVALTTMRVAESRAPRAAGPDWAGFVIFTAALASLVYGLIESNQRSFTDGLVLGCLAAAAVLFAVFVIVERRSAHPMFDLTLLRLPTFSGGSVAAFGLSASTFRQVGIATGIALLGTLFSNDVKTEVLTRTAAVPGLSARGPQIAGAVQTGQIGNVIARLPAPARRVAGTITRAAFTTGLDRILLVTAIIAFVAGVVSLAAIRSRDFARAAPGVQEGPPK